MSCACALCLLRPACARRRDLPRADAVHGNCTQTQREVALRRFRSGRVQVLVATDVAARGLDVPHVTAVINFDVPQPGRVRRSVL